MSILLALSRSNRSPAGFVNLLVNQRSDVLLQCIAVAARSRMASPIVTRPCSRANSTICSDSCGSGARLATSSYPQRHPLTPKNLATRRGTMPIPRLRKRKAQPMRIGLCVVVEVARIELASGSTLQSGLHA